MIDKSYLKLLSPWSVIFIFLLATIFTVNIYSQKSAEGREILAVHPRAGILFNTYNSDFNRFKGLQECNSYESGSGLGFTGSITLEREIFEKLFLGLGLGISDRSGKFALDLWFPIYDSENNNLVQLTTENTIDAKLMYLDIAPEVRYSLLDNFFNGPLRAAFVLRIGFPLSGSFDQKETIKSPATAYFINDGNRVQQVQLASGDFTTLSSPLIGISIGAENLLKISERNYLTQQVLLDYNFNNVLSDADWTAIAIRLEAGLRFSFYSEPEALPEPEPEPEPEPVVTEVVPEPELNLKLVNTDLEILTGNELLATLPLVNAVFFDRNSSKLPDYYATNDFVPPDNETNAVDIHKYVLPRIMRIIKKNPGSSIILEGATSGPDYEPEGLKLAGERAEAIRQAFLKLGLSDDIISVKKRIFPQIVSNQDFEKGVVENQRVDIIVKNAPLQEYVNLQRYAELDGDIELAVSRKHFPGNSQFHLTSTLSDKEIFKKVDGSFKLPVKKRLNNENEKIEYKSKVSAGNLSKNETDSIDPSTLPKRQVELNLDNFEAVLMFDYDKSYLTESNKSLLKQLTEILPAGSSIIIYGSADSLGSNERNVQLERERADNTEEFIRSDSGDKFNVEATTEQGKFSEETPQGRFLSRSIRIRVR